MDNLGLKPIPLLRDIGLNIAASLILGAAGKFLLSSWAYAVLFGAFGLLTVGFYFRKNYDRFLKLKRGGVKEYYYTFDLSQNKGVLDSASESFCYFGVTAATVVEFVRARTDNPGRGRTALRKCSFLLMDPESEALKRQIAFRNGVTVETPLESIDPRLRADIEQEYKTAGERTMCSIKALKELSMFKEGNLEIRLHEGFLPWWMYVVDDAKICLGVLERGKNGLDAPVVVMTKVAGFPSPFDAFKNMWDIAWANSKPVP